MIRDDATQTQVEAADPHRSTWLSANAGSGKTRVLTDRVARLLLEDVQPQNILCLTYTKAAASEMQNRLFRRLGAWAMMDDRPLRAELDELGAPKGVDLSRARTLFARAIETPGGLKIQTIHSFCSAILRRFPLEAGVSPQFREIEEREAQLLREEVLDEMAAGPDAPVLRDVLRHIGGAAPEGLAAQVLRHRDGFREDLDDDALRHLFGLQPMDDRATLMADIFSRDNVEILRDLARACAAGSTADQRAGRALAQLDLRHPGDAELVILQQVLLFGAKAKDPFGPKIGAFPTKATREAHPDLALASEDLMALVAATRDTLMALTAFDRALALHRFAACFIPRYDARKTALGVLDFDDLITRTRDLLQREGVAEWVLFRLDGGIDHVLVDEAQDTSPAQWQVIRLLTEEFGAAKGSREDVRRTVFVVGDKKQSIYSFQGADPRAFDTMNAHFAERMAADDPLQVRELLYSFRSAPEVLRVVDETFRGDMAAGLGPVRHLAFKSELPGRVDLWPAITPPEDGPEELPWDSPVDEVSPDAPEVELAHEIAAEILRMTQQEHLPEMTSDGIGTRPVTEGDVLVMVRSRGVLFNALIRACKAQGLAIAGSDRLEVAAELAVKDIRALLQFLALPEDDLSLAATLKSPLFGWSEQDLYALAEGRPKGSYLWQALRESTAHPATLSVLKDLRDRADFLRPYELIDRILIRHDGRRRLLARLGKEAEDGIDALLQQALSYEAGNVPELTSFLTWLDTDALEIKRQMEGQGDRIRVMSVHGAKGLEAPIVILPQTAQRRTPQGDPILIAGDVPVWRMSAEERPDAMEDMVARKAEAESEEDRRLLYVAMTRAENWLIVAGAGKFGDGPADSWYNMVADGMDRAGAVETRIASKPIRRLSGDIDWNALPEREARATDTPEPVALPKFGPVPLVGESAVFSPSDLGGEKIVAGDPAASDAETALAQGRLFHVLMEHLPTVAEPERLGLAKTLLAAHPDSASAGPDMAEEAVALLARAELAPLFSESSLAEVAVTAAFPNADGRRLHGIIDRLLIEPDRVLAVDFKTNQAVPEDVSDVPEGLLRQMGAYAAALEQVYPGRRIETAILWTRTGELMNLPPELTAAALSRATLS